MNMKEITATFNEVSCDFKEKYENVEVFVYSMLAFAIPFIFPHPQQITGTVVNAFLIIAALHFRGWKVAPLVILPSVAAVLNGMLFGPFTIFIVYMMPAIWLGNLLLVYLFKRLHVAGGLNYWATLFVSSIAKAGLLFGIAHLFVNVGVLPAVFLTAMGIMQLGTAIAGGIAAFALRALGSYLLK